MVVTLAILIASLAIVLVVRVAEGGHTRSASRCTYTSVAYYPQGGGRARFWLIGARDPIARGHIERVRLGRAPNGRQRWFCIVRVPRPRLRPGGNVALRQR